MVENRPVRLPKDLFDEIMREQEEIERQIGKAPPLGDILKTKVKGRGIMKLTGISKNRITIEWP